MGLPFIVLSDEGLRADLQPRDIEILVKDMQVVVGRDAVNAVVGVLGHSDCYSI